MSITEALLWILLSVPFGVLVVMVIGMLDGGKKSGT